jgi:hypothetical protein
MLGVVDMLKYFGLGAFEKRINWRNLKRCPKEIAKQPQGWVQDRLERVISNDKWLSITIISDKSSCDEAQFVVTFNAERGLFEMYSRVVMLGSKPEYSWQESYTLDRLQDTVFNYVCLVCMDDTRGKYIRG